MNSLKTGYGLRVFDRSGIKTKNFINPKLVTRNNNLIISSF